jgi:hypothetical protein
MHAAHSGKADQPFDARVHFVYGYYRITLSLGHALHVGTNAVCSKQVNFHSDRALVQPTNQHVSSNKQISNFSQNIIIMHHCMGRV